MTKPAKTPLIFTVRRKHKNSPGPAQTWLSLFIHVTATNDQAYRGLLNANPVTKKAGLKTNQTE